MNTIALSGFLWGALQVPDAPSASYKDGLQGNQPVDEWLKAPRGQGKKGKYQQQLE